MTISEEEVSEVVDDLGGTGNGSLSDITIDAINESTESISRVVGETEETFNRIFKRTRTLAKYLVKSFKDIRGSISESTNSVEEQEESQEKISDSMKDLSKLFTTDIFANMITEAKTGSEGSLEQENMTVREIRDKLGSQWNLTKEQTTEFRKDLNALIRDTIKANDYKISGEEVTSAVSDLIEGGIGSIDKLLYRGQVETADGKKDMYLAEVMAIAKKEGVNEDTLKYLTADFNKGLISIQNIYDYLSRKTARNTIDGYSEEIDDMVNNKRGKFEAFSKDRKEAQLYEERYAREL